MEVAEVPASRFAGYRFFNWIPLFQKAGTVKPSRYRDRPAVVFILFKVLAFGKVVYFAVKAQGMKICVGYENSVKYGYSPEILLVGCLCLVYPSSHDN